MCDDGSPAPVRAVARTVALESLYCDPAHSQHDIVSNGELVPPFCVQFCPNHGREHVLAAADEDGTITMVDSQQSRDTQRARQRARWRAHNNAIFAIEWLRGRDAMLTGSGDQSCRLWDMHTQQEVSYFRGHTGSVKAVSCSFTEPAVFR